MREGLVGTALRAFGLSGNQTFVFGTQFRSGVPMNFFTLFLYSTMSFILSTLSLLFKHFVYLLFCFTLPCFISLLVLSLFTCQSLYGEEYLLGKCKDVRVSVASRQCQGTSNQGLAMIGRERRDD